MPPRRLTSRLLAKSRRLVDAGRVRPAGTTRYGGGRYRVRGDSGREYEVEWHTQRERWLCGCPAGGRCSHVLAVEEYRRREQERPMSTTMQEQQQQPMPQERPAGARGGTQMAVYSQTAAMTPQIAPVEPMGDELDALIKISEKLSRSGLFRSKRKVGYGADEKWLTEYAPPEDVLMIVLAGRDFGLSAAASARHLSMVQGALCTDAELMRARLHQFGYEYDLAISEKIVDFPLINKDGKTVRRAQSPEAVTCTIWRRSDPSRKWSGTYMIHEAVQAGLTKPYGGYEKNPEDMLIARATTRTTRRYAPEVMNKTYLPEEIGFEEQPDGQEGTRLVRVEVEEEAAEPAQQAASPTAAAHDTETGEILDADFTADDDPGPDPNAETAPPPDEAATPEPEPAPAPPPWAWPEAWEAGVRRVMAQLDYKPEAVEAKLAEATSSERAQEIVRGLKMALQNRTAADLDFGEDPGAGAGSRLDDPAEMEGDAGGDGGDDDGEATVEAQVQGPRAAGAEPTPEQAEHWVETWATAAAAVEGDTVPEELVKAIARKDVWAKHMMVTLGVSFMEQEELCRRFELPGPGALDKGQRLGLIWYVERYGKA